MEKNIYFVISGPKSNYPENLDLIDKKNGQTYKHPIALYKGINVYYVNYENWTMISVALFFVYILAC